MCVKYCRVTSTITYLYFLFVKKKSKRKSLSAVFFLKAMTDVVPESSCVFKTDTLEGSEVRLGSEDWQEVAVLIKKKNSFILLPGAFRPSRTLLHRCILKRNIQSWACRKTVQMFIFYSFQVPVFCGVIWILTNSLKWNSWGWRSRRTSGSGSVRRIKSCITLYKKTSSLVI